MIDQNGFEISRPKTINLKTPVSRFDFNGKHGSLLKWIVTAGSGDNRLVMTGRLPEQATESPGWLHSHSPAHVGFKTDIRIVPSSVSTLVLPILLHSTHSTEMLGLRKAGPMDRWTDG